jgi:hypothetical protein
MLTDEKPDALLHGLSLSRGGRLAWVGEEGDQSSLYLYSDTGMRQVAIANMDYASIMVNDAGLVVWQGFDGNDAEIFLYKDGKLIQITDNDTEDAFPWINNLGQIVWTGSDGTDLEIYLYEDGAVTQITDNEENDIRPQINDAGQILWWGGLDNGLFVFLYDKGTVTTLSAQSVDYYDEHRKSCRQLNDKGQAVWTAKTGDYTGIFWFDGVSTTRITDNMQDDLRPTINNAGQIAWQGYDGNDFEIFLFDGEQTLRITDNGTDDVSPAINVHGQVVWQADSTGGTDIYLYSGGSTVRVSEEGTDAVEPLISDNDCIMWATRIWDEQWRNNGIFLRLPAAVAIPANALNPQVETIPGIVEQSPASLSLPEGFSMGAPADSPGPEDPLTFVVMGDSRGKDISWIVGERFNKAFLKFMSNKIVSEIKPDLVVFIGDMDTMAHSITGHHYLPDWIKLLKPVTDAGIALYVAKGNHEMYNFYGAFRKSYQDEYQSYFSNMHGITSLEGYENLAFSFKYGSAYFVIFDSFFCWKAPWYKISDYHYYGNVGDTQLAWLEKEAARAAQSGATHLFALSHAPVFSAEGVKTFANMKDAWMAFSDNDFDIDFGAHEHLYCRKVIDADPDAGNAYANSMAQIITGAAGASTDSKRQVKVDMEQWHVHLIYNYVVVNVDKNQVKATAYGVSNDLSLVGVIDTYTYTK